MLKSEVGLCNFSVELSPFDINTHLFFVKYIMSTGVNDRNNFYYMLI